MDRTFDPSHNVEPLHAHATRAAAEAGCQVIAVELKRAGPHTVVQLTIDRPDGVTVEDCAEVSRKLTAKLEDEPTLPDAYRLEVSSPGLCRPLLGAADYQRFRGREALVQTHHAICGQTRFKGQLLGLTGDGRALAIRPSEDQAESQIPLAAIAWARLDFDPGADLKRPAGRKGGRR